MENGVGAEDDIYNLPDYSYLVGDVGESDSFSAPFSHYHVPGAARSINIYDLANLTHENIEITKKNSEIQDSQCSGIVYPTIKEETGYSTSVSTITYVGDVNHFYVSSIRQADLLLKDKDGNKINYWIASRGYDVSTRDVDFSVYYIDGNYARADGLFNSDTDGRHYDSTRNHGVRPIVYLKSTLQTDGKNSSGEWKIIDK